MCSTDTAYPPARETRGGNGEPKVSLKISENLMIPGAALWNERNSI